MPVWELEPFVPKDPGGDFDSLVQLIAAEGQLVDIEYWPFSDGGIFVIPMCRWYLLACREIGLTHVKARKMGAE
jgi:hypothetical protein